MSINWTKVQLEIETALSEFPYAAISEIIGFIKELGYEITPHRIISAKGPTGLCAYQQQLFICQNNKIVTLSNLEGKIEEESALGSLQPSALEIDEKSNQIYAIDNTHVSIFSLTTPTRDLVSAWSLPMPPILNQPGRGLKLDGSLIYLTMWGYHGIFICDKTNGALKNKFGNPGQEGRKAGEFKNPSGITLDHDGVLYICDPFNCRVQALDKKSGAFRREFGHGFLYHPYGITFDGEDLLYVGDHYRLTLWSRHGDLIQRIGGNAYDREPGKFSLVCGVAAVGNELFVSDRNNNRIQVFQRVSEGV